MGGTCGELLTDGMFYLCLSGLWQAFASLVLRFSFGMQHCPVSRALEGMHTSLHVQ